MGRPAGEDRIEIREGVYIYLRNSPVWQVYFKLKGSKKAIRRSLGTKDKAEARRLASEEHDQARLRQLSGKPELGVSFSKLCDEYLASLPSGGSKTYHEDTIRRHLSPFFIQHVPDFSEIRNADVLAYIQWRREKGTAQGKEPKAQTLNRENVVLSGLIKFAVTRGYLPKADAPDVKALKSINARRPNFTRGELKTLLKSAKARIKESNHPKTMEQRRLLYDWIGVLANTGLRPNEAHSLTWSNVHLNQDDPYLHIKRNKTKLRDVVPLDPAVGHLKAIRERQREYLSSNKKKLAGTDHVFSLPDPTTKTIVPVKSFKTAFNNLIEACKFDDRGNDLKWSAYSLRHSYATMRLEEGTNVYVLKDQMGTSVRMIEAHYGHVITREQRQELTKTRDGQMPTTGMAEINKKFDAVVQALRQDKSETVTEIVRKQVLAEWRERNSGKVPGDGPGDDEIFEGLAIIRMRELGQSDFYEPPEDLPDSLPK
tara:strand:+ start:1863 stop:3314 length:1452 start_codon:yes stop_codon:yes gene_type:complete